MAPLAPRAWFATPPKAAAGSKQQPRASHCATPVPASPQAILSAAGSALRGWHKQLLQMQ